MKYFVSITDLHATLIEGIREGPDSVLVFPKRGPLTDKLRAVPRAVGLLLRVTVDRNSHVYVSHPFSIVTAAFISVGRRVSFFDDGTAYYAPPPLPNGRRVKLDRLLTRRAIAWTKLDELPSPTYLDVIRHSRAESFHCMFPQLIPQLPLPIKPINLTRAFSPQPSADSGFHEGLTLFLDSTESQSATIDAPALLMQLEAIANESPAGVVHFKPHPTEMSRLSMALREYSWAVEVFGSLEALVAKSEVSFVYSFYSSGSIVVKLMQPNAALYNLRPRGTRIDPGLRRLFSEVGAKEIEVES